MRRKGGDANQHQTTFFKPQKQFKGLDENYNKMEKSRADFSATRFKNMTALDVPASLSE